MEKPRWYDEEIKSESPSDDIPCKKCYLRAKDRMCGSTKIPGHTLAVCEVFYECKPSEILIGGSSCPYFVNEDEVGDE